MRGNLDFEYLATATATALHLQWPLGGWSWRHQSMTSLQRQVSAVVTEVELS